MTSDSKNCGSCGHDCFGGACSNGTCQPAMLVKDQLGATYLAVNSVNLYWTARGTVLTMPIAGGPITSLYQGDSASGIALDDRYVYWSSPFAILRMPLGGGEMDKLFTTTDTPLGLAVDANNFYFSTFQGSVIKVPITGGSPTTIYSQTNPNFAGIAVSANTAFFADWGVVLDVPLSGGAGTVFAAGSDGIFGVALDAEAVYFSEQFSGSISKTTLSSAVTTVVIPPGFTARAGGVALDAKSIYWIGSDSNQVGAIYRLAK